jgi:hypothetical protein
MLNSYYNRNIVAIKQYIVDKNFPNLILNWVRKQIGIHLYTP